jgi:hypothetical protein
MEDTLPDLIWCQLWPGISESEMLAFVGVLLFEMIILLFHLCCDIRQIS